MRWLLGSLFLLVAKSHQEVYDNIDDFIYHLCVIYRPLNSVTRIFEVHIPRCTNNVRVCYDSSSCIQYISLKFVLSSITFVFDEMIKKNVIFTPTGKKEKFKVIPFCPKNTPIFYTIMIKCLRNSWIFFLRNQMYYFLDNSSATVIYDDRIIIDESVLFFNDIPTTLH